MTARPFMPLFVGDYLLDTRDLSRSDHGGYMLLIMEYWAKGGPLPDDDKVLRRITLSSRYAWLKLRPKMEKFFTIRDGFWHHKRIDSELRKIKCKKGLPEQTEDPRASAPARGSIHTHKGVDRSPPTAGDLTVPGQEANPQTPLGGLRARDPAGKEKETEALVEEGAALVNGNPNFIRTMLNAAGPERFAEHLSNLKRRYAHIHSPLGYLRTCCLGDSRSAGRKPAPQQSSDGPPAWLKAMTFEQLYPEYAQAAAAA